MSIVLFMVAITVSSVFVMMSLGYASKSGNVGYFSKLGKLFGLGKKEENYVESNGGIEGIDKKTAELREQYDKDLAARDKKTDRILESFDRSNPTISLEPDVEKILEDLNKNDSAYEGASYKKEGQDHTGTSTETDYEIKPLIIGGVEVTEAMVNKEADEYTKKLAKQNGKVDTLLGVLDETVYGKGNGPDENLEAPDKTCTNIDEIVDAWDAGKDAPEPVYELTKKK